MTEAISLYLDADAEIRARSSTGGRFKRSVNHNINSNNHNINIDINNNNNNNNNNIDSNKDVSKRKELWERCDFSSRNFVLELFNFCLELTRMKIASDLIHPVPQVGPLVMDVIEQRNTVIEQVRERIRMGHSVALKDMRTKPTLDLTT